MERKEIISWLIAPDAQELFARADEVRRRVCGEEVHLRGLLEFSNYCRRNCHYCGLRRDNAGLGRYRMSNEEIYEAGKKAVALGYKTLVLQSGEDPALCVDELCGLVKRIKRDLGCAVTLCIGERTYDEYKKMRAAGADRYLLRFETSDRDLFRRLKPDANYENRFTCLSWLRELGYQVGSGIMVGLPGQTMDILVDDILCLAKLDLDMIGIGPFIAHPQTPLSGAGNGTLDLTLRVVALTRIVTEKTHMPATTAIGSIDPLGRQKALQCGANVMMPNVTPDKYRRYYEIYPHKICIEDKPGDCRQCVEGMLAGLRRRVASSFGHSLKTRS